MRKIRATAELDLSAFSDIAFLLIIFFILTTTFVKPFGHKMDVPAGTSDAEKKDETLPSVVLRGEAILWGEKGEEISFEELRRRLDRQQFAKQDPERRLIVVECTKDVPYEHYFRVVMAISEEGAAIALLEDEKGAKQ